MHKIAYTTDAALNARIHAVRMQRAASGFMSDNGVCFASAEQLADYNMRREANRLWNLWQDGLLSSEKADHE